MSESFARLEREKQLSSIEAEIRLRDAQKQVLHHTAYARLQERTLKEFWPKNFTPAPFIEDLRFKEFANMPLENLLRKRSFTANKLNAILLAVDAACAEGENGEMPLISPKLLVEYLRTLGFELTPIAATKKAKHKISRQRKTSQKKRLGKTAKKIKDKLKNKKSRKKVTTKKKVTERKK